ncbi:hypothetical protein [Streptomyces sp. NPDC001404]|uniref:LppU/SCO3897 family protein n=1 Tax=Streptomyces sp. NPDC001404 TaxID=3364571 RepID=UPI0036884CFC
MTPGRSPVVEHHTLALGRQLGRGGQGTVYEVTNKRINQADGGGWDVAYKEYTATVLPDLDAAALASQVDLLGELDAAEGRWLCDKTAWPAVVVEREGQACGFLMRAVPDRFRFAYQSLAGTTVQTRRLANLEYLLNDDTYVAGVGLTISERDRLLLLADLAAALARLHRIGIAVGDLSPKNLLFTTDPKPECFLIDCDAMRLRGATVLPQAETPDWRIPAGEESATRTSDIYKLTLLAIRLFARDQTAADPTALAAISPALGDLAHAGLTTDPARRPAPTAWAEQLTTAAATASTAPATAASSPRKPHRPPPASTSPAPGHSGGIAHTPVGNQISINWPALKAFAAVAALIVVVAVFVATHSHGGSSSASHGSPHATHSQGSGSDDSGMPTRPSPTPLSAEDKEFSNVSTDDCLSNYTNMDRDWTPSTPSTTSCSDTDAYFRVASVLHSTACTSDDITWSHSNSDGTRTRLCLNRNYAAGQCTFAHAKDDSLFIYTNAATPCYAPIPDSYQYTVQLTTVYPDGASDDACGDDRLWKVDSGATLCGKAIRKHHGLPDM